MFDKNVRAVTGGILMLILIALELFLIVHGFPSKTDGGWGWPPSILIPTIGLVAFLGILLISNVYSKDPGLTHGEMRKAITASVLLVYFFFIILVLFANSSPVYRLNQGGTPSLVSTAVPTEQSAPTPQGSSSIFLIAQDAATTTPPPTEPPPATEPSEAVQAGAATDEPAAAATKAAAPIIDSPFALAGSIANAFTTLVGVVIGFYFTTRAAENVTDKILRAKNPNLPKSDDE